jgi:hypothetical protein
MEDLFSTNLAVNNQNINYRVTFDNNEYVFMTEADMSSFSRFSFRREADQWVDADALPPEIRTQAVEALERYLLKQH